ncbi:MAG: NADH-quinone oxidoreductase subunit M [Spirochaetota bacterium]
MNWNVDPYILIILTGFPLIAAAVIAFLPSRRSVMTGAMIAAFAMEFVMSLHLPVRYAASAGMQYAFSVDWIPLFGIRFALCADGISIVLILLTTITFLLGAIAAKIPDTQRKAYAIAILIIESAVIGVFSAADMFLFYIFWEAMLIPAAILIAVFGSGARVAAAFKFFLFTFAGSIFMLIAMIVIASLSQQNTGVLSFSLTDAVQAMNTLRANAGGKLLTLEILLFLGFFIAFAVKTALFPLHIWAPDTYASSPVFVTVILSAVLLKMGGYGLWRFVLPLFPGAVSFFQPYIIALGIAGILYAALIALVQKDIKRLLAYSSVSHIGFAVVGIFSLSVIGAAGGILQLFNHGISIAMLFILAGILTERSGSSDIDGHGGLAKPMPLFAVLLTIAALASIALPATGAFVSEILSLAGLFSYSMWATIAAIPAVILGAVYMLTLVRKTIYGPLPDTRTAMKDLTLREAAPLIVLAAIVFFIGIYPSPLMKLIEPNVKTMLAIYPSAK